MVDTTRARVFDPVMLRRILLLVLLMCGAAHAQGLAAAPGVAPVIARPAAAAPAAPPLTAEQAQAVLDVLKDDRKRAEFIATLDAVAHAVQATSPDPAAGLPLAPDSLGAQLLVEFSAGLDQAQRQLGATISSVNDLPLLRRWVVNQASDPIARRRLFDAVWKLVVVVALGIGAEWSAARLLGGLWRRLDHAAPGAETDHAAPGAETDHAAPGAETDSAAPGAEADSAAQADDDAADPGPDPNGEIATRVRRNRLAGAMRTLQLLPFLIARLALDLLPTCAFLVTAGLALQTALGEPAITRMVIMAVVRSYVIGRLVLCLTHALVSPAHPRLRLLTVSDWMAAFLVRWVRRVTLLAVTGIALGDIGLLFGMYRVASDSLLKLFALAVHVCLVLAVLQCRSRIARQLRAPKRMTGALAALRNRLAEKWHVIAIFYIVALWLVWALELRDGYTRLLRFFLVTTAIVVAARVAAILALGSVDRVVRIGPELSHRYPGLERRAGFYHPMLRRTLMASILGLTAFALLAAWGYHPQSWFEAGRLGARALQAAVLIAVTLVLAALVWEGTNAATERHLAQLDRSAQLARSARLRTLLPMVRTALLVTIVLIVALMSLSEIGVNIAPLLAGAGVVGIAVGFGSQKLVQDLITGLFLLLENAMQVGDVVTLGGLSGTVEAVSIRTIRLRALDGSLHIIPFSAVTTVTNQTRDYSYALVDVSVGLNEEPDRMADVLREVAAEMRAEETWRAAVTDDLDVMGVEKFIDLAWVLRVRLKTLPASRWAVARELNRRIKLKFDELAIESPFTSFRVLSDAQPGAQPGAPAQAPKLEQAA